MRQRAVQRAQETSFQEQTYGQLSLHTDKQRLKAVLWRICKSDQFVGCLLTGQSNDTCRGHDAYCGKQHQVPLSQ